LGRFRGGLEKIRELFVVGGEWAGRKFKSVLWKMGSGLRGFKNSPKGAA